MNFSIFNLFSYDRKPLRLRDGQQVTYGLCGKWQVREYQPDGTGKLIEELEEATAMAAWLNQHEAELA